MSWMTRGFAATGRGLALTALAVLSAVSFVAHVALLVPGLGLGMVFLLPGPYAWARWLPDLARRAAGGIPSPYPPAPVPPEREPDGMYRSGQQLYKHRWWPSLEARINWVLGDRATWRDIGWLALNPVVGMALALAPAALLAGGLVLAGLGIAGDAPYGLGRWAVPAGLVAAVAGVAAAPSFLAAHAAFTRVLLRAPRGPAVGSVKTWLFARCLTFLRIAILLGLTVVSALWAVASLVVLALFAVGMVFVLPDAAGNMRPLLNLRRRLAGEWSGAPVEQPYRPQPRLPHRRPDGFYQVDKHLYKSPQWTRFAQRLDWVWHDPATWRDVLFVLLDPLVGGALLLSAIGTLFYGFIELVVPTLLGFTGLPDIDPPPLFAGTPGLSLGLGLALMAFGVAVAPAALRLDGRWAGWLLKPTEKARLDLRVRQLTESRAEATEAQAAELRRIERDLHDGAQARLVAVGLTLGTIEQLLDTDPAAARKLLAEARETSAKALAELRDLVRGVHPPVLAERGLGDAVRALALDSPVPATVSVDLPGRLEAPIEAAVYFAVSEALANAAKHARARTVAVDLSHDGATLTATVTDDGRGGADPDAGGGLRGMRQRLGAFDGTVRVSSPKGGPTVVTLEVPCASSSPRTSTS